MRTLSARARRVVVAIGKYTAEHGYAPSLRELAALVGLASWHTANYHVHSLTAGGYLRRTPNHVRTVALAEDVVWSIGGRVGKVAEIGYCDTCEQYMPAHHICGGEQP